MKIKNRFIRWLFNLDLIEEVTEENKRLRLMLEDKWEHRLMEFKGYDNSATATFYAPALIALLAKQLDDWFLKNSAKNNITTIMAYGVDERPNDSIRMGVREYDVTVQRRWGESVADQRNKYCKTLKTIVPFAPEGGWKSDDLCEEALKVFRDQKKLIHEMTGEFYKLADLFSLGDMPLCYSNLATAAVDGAFEEYCRLREPEAAAEKLASNPPKT